MGDIVFENIPVDILTPGTFVEFDNSQANQGLALMPHRIIVIGQKLAAGTAETDRPLLVFDHRQAAALGGQGSMAHRMIRALKRVNSTTELWALFLDDADASVAAMGSLKFSGPATAAGVISLYVAGERIQVGVAATDTAAEIATAVSAAINANADLPASAAVDGDDATLVLVTARNKGECGNDIDLRASYYADEKLPAGVGIVFTAMAGGAGNPDVTDVFAAIGDEWYTTYVMPWTDAANLAALETELRLRSGPMKMIDSIAYAGKRGSQGALAAHGLTRNSPWVTTMGVNKGLDTPCEWAAAYAGAAAFAAGIDPAQPVSDIILTGLKPPAKPDIFTREERDILLHNGIATFTVDASGNVVIERAITGYRLDGNGLSDRSYLDSETLRTLSYLRYTLRARWSARFRRKKLGQDGSRGPNVVTPKKLRGELIALAGDWLDLGLIEDIEQFKRDARVEISSTDPNRVNVLVPANLINQLRVTAAGIQFIL